MTRGTPILGKPHIEKYIIPPTQRDGDGEPQRDDSDHVSLDMMSNDVQCTFFQGLDHVGPIPSTEVHDLARSHESTRKKEEARKNSGLEILW